MLDGLLRDEHGLGENILLAVSVGGVDVSAGATDLRQHLMRHPPFELVSFRLAGAKHEHVEAGFVDNVCLTLTP